MIAETDARAVLAKNLARTESLISAMDKIYGYNRIYRNGLRQNLASQIEEKPFKNQDEEFRRLKMAQEFTESVKDIQERELRGIKRSCGEHAIISLATAFETYCKEVVQELLRLAPDFFVTKNTHYANDIRQLVEDPDARDYEDIVRALRLRSRWDYYKFFEANAIPFLSSEGRDFIERIYAKRNNFVHNAGKEDSKLRAKMAKRDASNDDPYVSAEAKKMRTKFRRMMFKVDEELKLKVSNAAL